MRNAADGRPGVVEPEGEPGPGAVEPEEARGRTAEEGAPRAAPPIRIPPPMIALLIAGLVAALLIFWLEPSFTLRYVVVGVLGAIYVFLRFNDWK